MVKFAIWDKTKRSNRSQERKPGLGEFWCLGPSPNMRLCFRCEPDQTELDESTTDKRDTLKKKRTSAHSRPGN